VVILDLPSFTVEWYDVGTGLSKSALYYAGDFENTLMSKQEERYDEFTVNLIPYRKKAW
jgi:hypothetical protein